MKIIKLNNIEYEIVEDFKEGFNLEDTDKIYTDYFETFDYILGDWSYGKLRLKGFCNKSNKRFNDINNIDTKEFYIKDKCAYGCKYFLLKKTS